MKLDLETVRGVFHDVLAGRMTREAADRWAFSVVQREDAGSVTYVPPADRERIWAGVMYLYGLDTLEAPGEYLHSDEDIRAALKAKVGDASAI